MNVAGAVLPVLKELYDVVHNSGYGRGKDGKKQNPKVLRAKLEDGSVIVGKRSLTLRVTRSAFQRQACFAFDRDIKFTLQCLK